MPLWLLEVKELKKTWLQKLHPLHIQHICMYVRENPVRRYCFFNIYDLYISFCNVLMNILLKIKKKILKKNYFFDEEYFTEN